MSASAAGPLLGFWSWVIVSPLGDGGTALPATSETTISKASSLRGVQNGRAASAAAVAAANVPPRHQNAPGPHSSSSTSSWALSSPITLLLSPRAAAPSPACSVAKPTKSRAFSGTTNAMQPTNTKAKSSAVVVDTLWQRSTDSNWSQPSRVRTLGPVVVLTATANSWSYPRQILVTSPPYAAARRCTQYRNNEYSKPAISPSWDTGPVPTGCTESVDAEPPRSVREPIATQHTASAFM
mmetsp:Transcript_32895/g.86099  ORF Transcript_32895/g.86099 Transcript_32895/m.86099 type:complete len:239 (-) Transcript_32895:203-919(-)